MIQLPQILNDQITDLETLLKLQFDSTRRDVLKDNSSFDLQACPGSGKTTLLAAKLILLSQNWPWQYKGVCVLSHTNVARDEIIKKLHRHPSGYKFLSYPHFIGTIQEFVNRFLGMPYIRNHPEWNLSHIDNELFDRKAKSKLSQGTRTYLQNRHVDSLYGLSYSFDGETLQVNVPGFSQHSTSASYTNLLNIRRQLSVDGFFLYSDMYAFAEALLIKHPYLIETLRERFPIIMLDEMQDANKQQDELLQRIFPLNTENTIVQRFGDPDQAIFEFGEPNESYNQISNSFKYTIPTSHRFGSDISDKIKGLSSKKVALAAIATPESSKKHTLILYNNDTQNSVLDTFAQVISDTFEESGKICAKAVGAVAKQSTNDHGERTNVAIPDYWEGYSKPVKQERFVPNSLYEAVLLNYQKTNTTDLSTKYNLLFSALLELLYLVDKRDTNGKRYTKTKIIEYLKENNELLVFQGIVWNLLFNKPNIEDEWTNIVEQLLRLSPFDSIPNTHDFLAFSQDVNNVELPDISIGNIYKTRNDISLEVQTIHAVKGETHNATLVLETKHKRVFDIHKMLEYLTNPNKAAPVGEDLKRMRNLYVACSRPQSLLCLAMHKDNFDQNKKPTLESLGWEILDVSEATDTLREAS